MIPVNDYDERDQRALLKAINDGDIEGLWSTKSERWLVVPHEADEFLARPKPTLLESIDCKLDRVLELLCDDEDLEHADE